MIEDVLMLETPFVRIGDPKYTPNAFAACDLVRRARSQKVVTTLGEAGLLFGMVAEGVRGGFERTGEWTEREDDLDLESGYRKAECGGDCVVRGEFVDFFGSSSGPTAQSRCCYSPYVYRFRQRCISVWRYILSYPLSSFFVLFVAFSLPNTTTFQLQTHAPHLSLVVSNIGNCSMPSLVFQLHPTDHGTRHTVVILPAGFQDRSSERP